MTLRNTTIASVLALTLGSAAFANMTDMDQQVRNILDQNGYEHIALGDLTEAEKANIFTTATSEDSTDVRQALDGMELAAAPVPSADATVIVITPEELTPDHERQVKTELETRGYTDAQISSLTQAEVAEIFTVMTSGGGGDVEAVLDGIFDS